MINKCIEAVTRQWLRSSLVLLIIILLVMVIMRHKPDTLQVVSYFLIAAGTVVAGIAALYRNKPWNIIGTILLAVAGIGTGYFGNKASAVETGLLQKDLSSARSEINGLRDQLSETQGDMKVLIAVTELKDRSLEMNQNETQKRLSIVYQELFESLPQEADAWAKRFTELQPVREEGYKEIEQQRRERCAKEASFIPILFQLILKMFDERMQALSKNIDGISISKSGEVPNVLIFEEGQETGQAGEIRAVKLPNDRSIRVGISFGSKTEGLIKHYPKLFINESPSPPRPKRDLSIELGHSTGCFMGNCPIEYPGMDDKENVEKFLNYISERLDKMISELLSREPLI